MTRHLHIGTSGWNYDHWIGPFYPEDIDRQDMLSYYAKHFKTVEINNTFYNLPECKTFEQWRETVPKRFLFACKASRYITHMKKLKDPAQPLKRFMSGVEALGDRLGPILFQLPPSWGCNPERLKTFLEALPAGRRYSFEFRDESWFDERIYDLLREHNAAFCLYELAGRRSPVEVTADFVYIRLHGPEGAYEGQYDGRTLNGWARRFQGWREDGLDIYCYFDNDQKGYAAADAARLLEMAETD